MPLRTDAYYRKLAEDALRNAGMSEPPVSLDALAAVYALPVRRYPFPPFFSGAIVSVDGMPMALLNGSREERAARETLAHLLGHLLVILDDPEARFPRDGVIEHHDAEVVAEELVLPTFMISEQARKWFNDYRYLARLFAVSEGDMLEKMRDLGLVQDHGIYWDY
ncbi:MAG: hypothetical protein IBX62_00705 [Coriobacteriia bacterium]|nr:hypothetical protein [Coriobacteriia bacterium]